MATGTALTGKTGANIFLEYSGAVEIGTPKMVISRYSPIAWTYGTLANQCNLFFQQSASTDNTGVTIDLYTGGGTEKDCFGNLMTMTAIKFLYVKNTHATLTLAVFSGANALLVVDGTTDVVEIPPGGEMYWSAPTAAGVVTTTNLNLFLKCKTADTITYEVVAGGKD